MAAQTIDDVIDQLDDIINFARREESRIGFFPVLYRKVTLKVKEGIEAGRFEDGRRMEGLAAIFANRYVEALDGFRQGDELSRCWRVAFEAASRWRPLIVQHLLLGINAHVNLDLGVAVAQTVPVNELPNLKPDFDAINTILAELLDEVQEEIAILSPWLGLLDRVGGRTDEAIINFSMEKARAAAWRAAERLARLNPDQQLNEIDRLDREVEVLAWLIRHPPGWTLRLVQWVIRLAESNDIPRIIDVLR